ncbi:SRPBCC domain-containing protein [Reichenbachiella ulvae]|uniref:SRPBCC domain-containing protein n=1 Tax=Reichenbachiella ulvae TaxID=2980104 RepID=A0ABT3CYL0_9BACT|nr:SRPBCC domain-containing protein [Reichenbachiella ulvae]MCV9388303.1 SRPBCC domain-containing protein [Reichenbachiella ulvae]
MKLSISSDILINAPAEKVWSILMDFEKYPDWNPLVKEIKGNPEVGNTISVSLPGMNFKPEVLALKENSEFRWKGKLLFKGLFDGEHYFILEERDGGVELFHGEYFSGLLVGMLRKKLEGETLDGFKAMNESLKKLAEA